MKYDQIFVKRNLFYRCILFKVFQIQYQLSDLIFCFLTTTYTTKTKQKTHKVFFPLLVTQNFFKSKKKFNLISQESTENLNFFVIPIFHWIEATKSLVDFHAICFAQHVPLSYFSTLTQGHNCSLLASFVFAKNNKITRQIVLR